MIQFPTWLARLTRVFARHHGGVAAVEFACVLPVFLTLVLGGNELALAMAASRKVASLTRAVADLTTQYTKLSPDDVTGILNASTQIMAPFSASAATIVLSEISVNAFGIPTITWSRALHTAQLTPGDLATLPPGFNTPGTALILATVTYSYSPTFGASLIKPVTLSNHLYMVPRRSNTVDLT